MTDLHAQIKTKKELAALSNNIKKCGNYDLIIAMSATFNEVLATFYEVRGKTLKTYNEWRKEGYQVKKGEKAYTFWTKPINGKGKKEKKVENIKGGELEKTMNEYRFFGICKLFTEDQVSKEVVFQTKVEKNHFNLEKTSEVIQ